MQENFKIPDDKSLFVVMGMMRSGSNLLQQILNAIDGVTCHGEIFNPAHVGIEGKRPKLNAITAEMEKIDKQVDPCGYLNRLVELTDAEHVGFRLFEGHNNSLVNPLAADRRVFKIILVRNFLESYVSLEIARQTDQWLVNHANTRKEWEPVEIKVEAFKTYALRQSLFYHRIIRQCVLLGQDYLALEYSELNDPSTEAKLLGHFGTGRKLDRRQVRAQRQNPEPLSEKIANYDEVLQRLHNQRLDEWLLDS